VTRGIQPLRSLSHHLFSVGESQAGIYHWRGKEIVVETATPQDIWIDGEVDGQTPLRAVVIPKALEIVVPG
jgi:diacylglycerol kinase family enzyme